MIRYAREPRVPFTKHSESGSDVGVSYRQCARDARLLTTQRKTLTRVWRLEKTRCQSHTPLSNLRTLQYGQKDPVECPLGLPTPRGLRHRLRMALSAAPFLERMGIFAHVLLLLLLPQFGVDLAEKDSFPAKKRKCVCVRVMSRRASILYPCSTRSQPKREGGRGRYQLQGRDLVRKVIRMSLQASEGQLWHTVNPAHSAVATAPRRPVERAAH